VEADDLPTSFGLGKAIVWQKQRRRTDRESSRLAFEVEDDAPAAPWPFTTWLTSRMGTRQSSSNVERCFLDVRLRLSISFEQQHLPPRATEGAGRRPPDHVSKRKAGWTVAAGLGGAEAESFRREHGCTWDVAGSSPRS